jgi:hypothetical protein
MKSPVLPTASAIAGALLALAATALPAAAAQGFRQVRVDVSAISPMLAKVRADLQACLTAELQRTLAGRIVPGDRNAPTLVVRPLVIQFAPAVPTRVDTPSQRDSFGELDAIEGENVIVPAGRVSAGARVSLLATTGADLGGALADPQGNARRRILSLCRSYAYWLPSRLP